MDLNRVDWSAAARELTAELHGDSTPRSRRKLAALSSLRARFTDDHAVAMASTATALQLEPLDPIHRVRCILTKVRFGDLAGALADIEGLPEALADLPRILVIKAFVALRRGEASTARNIADRAVQIDPRCVAARFLYVEATLQAQRKGGLDKLSELPRGIEFEPAWADLLAKLAIVRPGDHRAVIAQLDRGVVPKTSRTDALVRSVLHWTNPATGVDQLMQIAESQAAGSRAEELALALLTSRLTSGDPTAACTTLHAMARRHADRPAMRRALAAALTQLAVAEASAERLSSALRIVQACIDLEPHEPVHQQNRAALFTLRGEHEAALDAWAALDQLHYRLALLGRLDPASASRYAAPHRMFALAARLSPGTTRSGVFVIERDDDGDLAFEVNQEVIDRDPEQLRQWLHHSRAALSFELLSLGLNRDRVLLGPASPAAAAERIEGLCLLVQSFAVLVADEGRRLADRLVAWCRTLGDATPQRYQPVALDAEAQAVQRHAIELYAELARLCFSWSPSSPRRGLVDEVIETLRAVAPLFDDSALARLIKDGDRDRTSALPYLRGLIANVLDIAPEDRDRALDARQRKRLANVLTSRLRAKFVLGRLEEASAGECELLAEELDIVRRDDPDSPFTEYVAAAVLATGGFLDEASRAISRFRKLTRGDHPLLEMIEKIQHNVKTARKDGAGKTRQHGPVAAPAGDEVRDLAAREAALDDQPTAIELYIELCHELALANRWQEAHAWAGRAIARCLTSGSQLRARELALELLGLEELARKDRGIVASFIAGARTSPLPRLETTPVGGVGLEYVRGLCLLAADRRDESRAAFAAALGVCTRGIYLPVLRPLAANVEQAVLAAARQDIDAACKERRYHDAYARITEQMATVADPAPYLLELARVQFSALLSAIGTSVAPLAAPDIAVTATWGDELAAALSVGDAVARTRALIELATRLYTPGVREAQNLARKLEQLESQLAAVAALDRANTLAAAGELEGALAALAELGQNGDRNPRVIRQRAIVLLQLERYDAADQAAKQLGEIGDAIARDFVARYPRLRLRRGIASASALIRDHEFVRARAVLDAMVAGDPEQQIELAYARACCSAAEGYHQDFAGDRDGALRLLFEALRWAESCIEHARAHGHKQLLELHDKLERDVTAREGALS